MFFSKLVWLVMNVSYLVVAYMFAGIHNKRVVYADKVVIEALKSVLTHAAIFLSILAFLDLADTSWHIIVKFYLLFFSLLGLWWIGSRKLIKAYRTRGFNYKSIIVIGGGTVGVKLMDELRSDAGYGYRILGFFDNNPHARSVGGYKGTLNDVADFVRDNPIDEMYCAIPDDEQQNVARLIRIAENNAVDFYYVPQFGRTVMRQFELQSMGDVPILAVHPYPLKNPINRVFKRAFDLLLSTVLLILSPLVIIPVAIGIKLSSPGPIFFVQKRTGYRGKAFNCYKFRTMRINDDSDTLQATKGDPRVTKFGNFLRRTSIDELPQFYNVWLGEMSVVGPRPHMVAQTEMYSELIDKYMLRHTIKPGITGWAQVRGYRGQTEELWQMEKRVEYDVWYAENWSFFLDMKIIVRTVWNALKGEANAY
jgi:putative colanic acid biosynthesis UDP-glucose lipid carrier transferase